MRYIKRPIETSHKEILQKQIKVSKEKEPALAQL